MGTPRPRGGGYSLGSSRGLAAQHSRTSALQLPKKRMQNLGYLKLCERFLGS